MINKQIMQKITEKITKLCEKHSESIEALKALAVILLLLAVYLWFSTYTHKVNLICSKQNNTCTIENTNLYGHKKYKSFELSSVIQAEHNITSVNRFSRTLSAISRPFSAVHEFVIIQKDNHSISLYHVRSSGNYNLSEIEDINTNVSEFNNFLDNNNIGQIIIRNF